MENQDKRETLGTQDTEQMEAKQNNKHNKGYIWDVNVKPPSNNIFLNI